ncbi:MULTISPECIES: hypothetical protein [Thermomonospora]|uniref:HAMP domain-containing protein n=1 Tax=Thermomonospora cellulosilytica TaxID=1411118 RepID=A0A7W3RB80_9ACTN|nr:MULTISPECIES: hypothetical protein [Thermomonospora]MBA9006030.1 HAMP domain-containing protein [Thermomonospora cellulosilytica]
MGWAQVFVAVASAGLLVLALCAAKVFRAVQGLGRELERTRRRLDAEHSTLRGELRRLRETGESDTSADGVRSS